MVEPFIFVGTAAIKEGQLETYKERFRKTAGLAEANEPRLLHFATYINVEGTKETTVQVDPDDESMASHNPDGRHRSGQAPRAREAGP